jgi:hypothetical protein
VVSFTADRKVSHWAGLDAVKKNISVSAGSWTPNARTYFEHNLHVCWKMIYQ